MGKVRRHVATVVDSHWEMNIIGLRHLDHRFLSSTLLEVQRAQSLGDSARSPLPGFGAAHLGDARAGPRKTPFSFFPPKAASQQGWQED